jgi:predicted amidohydrolase
VRIAIVQDGPVFNNKKQSLEKTCDIISEVGKEGAELIVFGECWLSGYPFWLDICADVANWDSELVKEIWRDTYINSIDPDSEDMLAVSSALRQNNMYAVIGANEVQKTGKGHSTIYNAILTYNNQGQLINHHRKLMPTYTEKLVHGLGDGHGLNAVETPFGRLGSLICWEHWMPMARQAMHDSNEDLHIALWPYVKEMHHIASRHYAIEGRCHVVSVGQVVEMSHLPKGLKISDRYADEKLALKGGSAIYDSRGEAIVAPLYEEKKIIIQELDFSNNLGERMNLSVSGHYQRPDVFEYRVNKDRQ